MLIRLLAAEKCSTLGLGCLSFSFFLLQVFQCRDFFGVWVCVHTCISHRALFQAGTLEWLLQQRSTLAISHPACQRYSAYFFQQTKIQRKRSYFSIPLLNLTIPFIRNNSVSIFISLSPYFIPEICLSLSLSKSVSLNRIHCPDFYVTATSNQGECWQAANSLQPFKLKELGSLS